MREYKFRGKRLDNHEWVYGSLVIDTGRSFIVTSTIGANRNIEINNMIATASEVDLSTVGEWTGIPDKRGKEMYEGDVVTQFGGKMWGLTYTIRWNVARCGFWLYQGTEPHLDLNEDRLELEVIGSV